MAIDFDELESNRIADLESNVGTLTTTHLERILATAPDDGSLWEAASLEIDKRAAHERLYPTNIYAHEELERLGLPDGTCLGCGAEGVPTNEAGRCPDCGGTGAGRHLDDAYALVSAVLEELAAGNIERARTRVILIGAHIQKRAAEPTPRQSHDAVGVPYAETLFTDAGDVFVECPECYERFFVEPDEFGEFDDSAYGKHYVATHDGGAA